MRKVLVVNVSSKVTTSVNENSITFREFELTELNQHLLDDWYIEKYDIVTNNITNNFSIIYQLAK